MKRLGLGLLTSAVAAAALVPFAHAADMALPPAAPAPYYRPALYDWTGIYFGGHVGAGYIQNSLTSTAAAALALTNSLDFNTTGLVGGAQVGANYEFAPWVVGIEGSWTSTQLGATKSATTIPAGTEQLNPNPLWLAAATARVGYARDDLMFYVKGGGAWMNIEYTEVAGGTQAITSTSTGFTAGAGLEYGFVEGWSGKLEYDFYDFGSTNYAFTLTPISAKADIQVLTVGINYRFNWAGGRPY
jgi:outer membrane immunogenic protein